MRLAAFSSAKEPSFDRFGEVMTMTTETKRNPCDSYCMPGSRMPVCLTVRVAASGADPEGWHSVVYGVGPTSRTHV